MITEDYVSFETAKLLKEKGFDCNTNCYYIENSVTRTLFYSPIRENHNTPIENNELGNHINISSGKISAPTLQMAMKWLREKHNLHIEIRITNDSMSDMVNVVRYYWVMLNTETGKAKWCDESTVYTVKLFNKSEEAGEDAIRHALEKLT